MEKDTKMMRNIAKRRSRKELTGTVEMHYIVLAMKA